MFNNKIFFTFIFIIISPNIFASNLEEWNKWYNANKTTLAGEMSCKITDQIIIKVKEGKPKRYSHYTNQPKIGDKLSLIYQTVGEKIKFQLKHDSAEYFDTSFFAQKGEIKSKIASFYNNSSRTLKYYLGRLTIRQDSLSFQKYNIVGGYSLELKRYYKSDWGGIFIGTYVGEPHVITLDCRNITDKIDEIIERYKTYPGKVKFKKNS